MEKGRKKKGAAMPRLFAGALLLALWAGMLCAANAQATQPAGCAAFPEIRIAQQNLSAYAGRLASANITVVGTQPGSCGLQVYGVDFTNGYDGEQFVLAMKGSIGRNVFALEPGQSKEFTGLIGVPPGTLAGNYSLQVTAYPDADHWKQASAKLALQVRPEAGSDAYWRTGIQVGWNAIPYSTGTGVYGCPNITEAYRYSPYKGDYIQMERYGSLFVTAPFEPNAANEGFGGLFVFSSQRCTMESSVPPISSQGSAVSLRDGQMLSIPPAWSGQPSGDIAASCMEQPHAAQDKVELTRWDAATQTWVSPAASELLGNGQVWRIVPSFDCTLDLQKALD